MALARNDVARRGGHYAATLRTCMDANAAAMACRWTCALGHIDDMTLDCITNVCRKHYRHYQAKYHCR